MNLSRRPEPNNGAALDAAMTLPLYSEHHWRRASERGRSPPKAAANGADQPRAFLHRSGVTLLEHPPGTPGNVRLNDAMSCGRPNTFAVRPRKPANKADAAARPFRPFAVGCLGWPAADPHR